MTEIRRDSNLPMIQRTTESADKASILFNPQDHWFDEYLTNIFFAVGRGQGTKLKQKLNVTVDPETNSITLEGTLQEIDQAAEEIYKRKKKTEELLSKAIKKK